MKLAEQRTLVAELDLRLTALTMCRNAGDQPLI
jgi:hypothetical protein